MLFAGLIITGVAHGQIAQSPVETPTVYGGTIDRYAQFESVNIKPRGVTVWMPENYRKGDPCDVLYMHDAQMLFDSTVTWNGQEWQVDEVLSRLIKEGEIKPCIVVAIDNTNDRLLEYFPPKTCRYLPPAVRANVDTTKYLGDAYLKFIVEELKPFVDEHYQPLTTPEHTFMMGSSMGGLISIYAQCEYPEVFGGVACLSSHLSFFMLPGVVDNNVWAKAFRDYLTEKLPQANSRLIYMDRGTEDIDAGYALFQPQVDTLLKQLGWNEQHFHTQVFPGHQHRETSWAKRLHIPVTFIMSKAK